MYEKDLRLSLLFDCYSELLSPQQRRMFDLYYNEDLSLSEIAEQCGITRQGVRDLCKRAEDELRSYEQALHLSVRLAALQKQSERMQKALGSLRQNAECADKKAILAAVKELESSLQEMEKQL